MTSQQEEQQREYESLKRRDPVAREAAETLNLDVDALRFKSAQFYFAEALAAGMVISDAAGDQLSLEQSLGVNALAILTLLGADLAYIERCKTAIRQRGELRGKH